MLLTAKWVLPIESEPIEDGAVLVSANLIKAVGRREDLIKEYPDESEICFKKGIILPGFVDLHTHLEYSVFRGICDDLPFSPWKIQLIKKGKKLSASDWYFSAQLGALETIQSGITCIADVTKEGASLKAAKERDLRGVIFCEVSEMDESKVKNAVAEAQKTVENWQKETENSLLKIGVSPYSAYNSAPSLFKAVSDWAKNEKLPACFHLAGPPDEYSFVKYGSGMLAIDYRDAMGWKELLWQPTGVSPIKYLEQWDSFESGNVICIHCIQVNDADIEILQKYNVAIAHCPKCGAKLGMGIAPLGKFMKRGLRVGIGTDSPASNNTMDFFDEMRVGLLLQRGLEKQVEGFSAEQFVKMATIGGAKALRMDNMIGSIKIGKQADLIAVDLSHSHQMSLGNPYSALVYTANQEDVVFTMVAGKILYNKGENLIDEEQILTQAEKVREKLR
ncbi:MAG: amidohydrolase family protein [Candidatus Subteraquimicrobiales bacterium]|nr:amidohydrolase family protein [Candidatus Subteraquimicrobiales bacterium]